MKHLFIPHKLAVLAKEKGFPNNTGSCLAAWEVTDNAEWLHFGAHKVGLLQAPLYQQVVDWLFDKHKLDIQLSVNDNMKWSFTINYLQHNKYWISPAYIGFFNTKYEALDKVIEEALNLI